MDEQAVIVTVVKNAPINYSVFIIHALCQHCHHSFPYLAFFFLPSPVTHLIRSLILERYAQQQLRLYFTYRQRQHAREHVVCWGHQSWGGIQASTSNNTLNHNVIDELFKFEDRAPCGFAWFTHCRHNNYETVPSLSFIMWKCPFQISCALRPSWLFRRDTNSVLFDLGVLLRSTVTSSNKWVTVSVFKMNLRCLSRTNNSLQGVQQIIQNNTIGLKIIPD